MKYLPGLKKNHKQFMGSTVVPAPSNFAIFATPEAIPPSIPIKKTPLDPKTTQPARQHFFWGE